MLGTVSSIAIIALPSVAFFTAMGVRIRSEIRTNRNDPLRSGEVSWGDSFVYSIGLFAIALYVPMTVVWSFMTLAPIGPAWLQDGFNQLYGLEFLPRAPAALCVAFFAIYVIMVVVPATCIWPRKERSTSSAI